MKPQANPGIAAFLLVAFVLFVTSQCLWAEDPAEARTQALEQKWEGVYKTLSADASAAADPVSQLLLAHACLATNRNNEALSLFASVCEEKDLNAWANWASTLTKENKDNAVALYLHGDALARQGKLDQAIGEFSAASGKDSGFALALVARGTVEALQGKADSAIVDLAQAVKAAPNLAEAHAAAGTYFVFRNEGARGARQYYDKAIEINPKFAMAYLGRACAHYGLGDFDDAYEDLEQAEEQAPDLAGICERNRAAVISVADRYLQMVGNPGAAGTPLESKACFERTSVSLPTGGKIDVYLVRPAYESSATVLGTLARSILDDFRTRNSIPADQQLGIMMRAHGFTGRAEDQIAHAAVMAQAAGDRFAIVVDFPQYRFEKWSTTSAPAAYTWASASNLAGKQTGGLNAGLNQAGKVRIDFGGISGGSEAWVKQWKQWEQAPEVLQNIKWGRVWLTAYPFSDLWVKSVQIPDSLLAKTDGICNVYTSVGHWSNPLKGDGITNLQMTRAGKGFDHPTYDDLTLDGKLNPAVLAESRWFGGASAGAMRTLTQTISKGSLPNNALDSWQTLLQPSKPLVSSSESFRPIPVSSFGQTKLADLWHWDASGQSAQDIASKTATFAKSIGQQSVVVRTDSSEAAKPIVDLLGKNGVNATIILGQKEGIAKVGTVTSGMSLNTTSPIVVGVYSGQTVASDIKTVGIRRDNPLYDLTRLTANAKGDLSGAKTAPVVIVGEDRFRTALVTNYLARKGVPTLCVPPDSDWRGIAASVRSPLVTGIQNDLAEKMRKTMAPSIISTPHPVAPVIPATRWQDFKFIQPTPVIPGRTPPGGIDCSMARAKIDKGKWLVSTSFGLCYPSPESAEETPK